MDSNKLEYDRLVYLETVIATVPECVAIIRKDFQIHTINSNGLSMIGAKSLTDIPQNGPLTFVAQRYRPNFRDRFLSAMDGVVSNIDDPLLIEVIRLDGASRWLECRLAPLCDNEGVPIAVIAVGRDVSDWHSAVASAADSAALLESILATVPDAMIVIDERGRITSFSTASEDLFGYRESEVLGKNISILIPPPHNETHNDYLEKYLSTGEKRIIGIGRVVEGLKRDGTIFPMELAVGEAIAGEHRAFTGFIRDLTESNRASEQLNDLQLELAHASRLSAVGTLASALAHELNQPLTAIANYVSAGRDMLSDLPPDIREILQEALGEAANEAVRAGQIVRRLRDFISGGDTNKQFLDLSNLIDDAAALATVGAREKGVDWSINIEPGVKRVLANAIQIQQVLVNLIRNAIEAMENSRIKQLNIRAKILSDDEIEISVADTGSGIPEELDGRLFEPFSGTKANGMGLGLSICRTIIEEHGGKLTAESNHDDGATFRFTLGSVSMEVEDAE